MWRWCRTLFAGLGLLLWGVGCTTIRPGSSARTALEADEIRFFSKPESIDGKHRSRADRDLESRQTQAAADDSSRSPARDPSIVEVPPLSPAGRKRLANPNSHSQQAGGPSPTTGVMEQGAEALPSSPSARRALHQANGLGTTNAWGHATTVRRGMNDAKPAASSDGQVSPKSLRQAHHAPGQSPLWGKAEIGELSPDRQTRARRAAAQGGSVADSSEMTAEDTAPKSTARRVNLQGTVRTASRSERVTPRAGALPTHATDSAINQLAASPHLADLIDELQEELADLPPGETDFERQAYLEKQVALRMLHLIAGQQELALLAIPGIDPADQEFWQQAFWGLTNYFDAHSIPDGSERATLTVSQFYKAAQSLQQQAQLELRNVSFCHKIDGFGKLEKYPRDEFSPGQEVLLYAEIGNFPSELLPDGTCRTRLKTTLEIYAHGAQGTLIERVELPETIDACRTQRRDFFGAYKTTIPSKLRPGPHVLQLIVEDPLTRRSATYSLNFMAK
ncbi:MAG: hypothetical protein ACKV0T_13715 [Planctomycetales bacterium]